MGKTKPRSKKRDWPRKRKEPTSSSEASEEETRVWRGVMAQRTEGR